MKRAGFTLIEMALACALAAVLMAGVLAVFGGIARDRARLAVAGKSEGIGTGRIVSVLRRDLSSAARMTGDSTSVLVLQTASGLDERTMAYVDRPAVVRYQIVDREGTRCLIRRQEWIDDPVSPQPLIDLVAMNVKSLSVSQLELGKMRLRIAFDGPAANLDQVLVLH